MPVEKPVAPTSVAPPPMPVAPPAPVADPAAPAAQGPRINRLTGLPFGAMPGETAGLNPDQVANADRMAADRKAQGAPTATPRDIAGAQRGMERDGVTSIGSLTAGAPRAIPVSRPAPVTGPTPRADGYQARSQREDWDRAAAADAARKAGKMGDYFAAEGKPEMAKAFPNRMTNREAVGIAAPAGETAGQAAAAEAAAGQSIYKPTPTMNRRRAAAPGLPITKPRFAMVRR
jgi:hypothetical protein